VPVPEPEAPTAPDAEAEADGEPEPEPEPAPEPKTEPEPKSEPEPEPEPAPVEEPEAEADAPAPEADVPTEGSSHARARLLARSLAAAMALLLVGALGLRALSDDDAPAKDAAPTSTVPGGPPVAIPSALRGQIDLVSGTAPTAAALNLVELSVTDAGVSGAVRLQVDGAVPGTDGGSGGCYAVDIDLGATPLETVSAEDGSLRAKGPVDVVIGYADAACASGAEQASDGRPGTLELRIAGGVASGSVAFGGDDEALTFSAVSAG
jgi:hypothetical protein